MVQNGKNEVERYQIHYHRNCIITITADHKYKSEENNGKEKRTLVVMNA